MGIIAKWFKWTPRAPVEPTDELERVVAQAILRYLEGDQSETAKFNGPSIWDLTKGIDPRLIDANFTKATELAKIWDIADEYADACGEPQAYRGEEKKIEGLKTQLFDWATEVLARPAQTFGGGGEGAEDLYSKVTYPLWIWHQCSNRPSVKCDQISDLVGDIENSDNEKQRLTVLDDSGRRCFVETDTRLELVRFDVIDEELSPDYQLMLAQMKAELS